MGILFPYNQYLLAERNAGEQKEIHTKEYKAYQNDNLA